MKKYIALILIFIISFSVLSLSGCSGDDPGTITVYEFNDNYTAGTPITKDIVTSIKIIISEGFVGGDGTVYTAEKLSTMKLITKDNWENMITEKTSLQTDVCKGTLFQSTHITSKSTHITSNMTADEIQKLHDFTVISTDYLQTRMIYEKVLQLDYRITAGLEDPLLIAPEYENVLDQVEEVLIQSQALSVTTQYTQLHSMINTWLSNDIAIYCQKMSSAILKNSQEDTALALKYKTIVYNDFSVITANIAAMGSVVNGAEIADIESWSPEGYINQQFGLPSNNDNNNNNKWWEDKTVPEADAEWILDPEIPANYIPVPGENELYMVIDDDGNVKEYRRRTKQDDGSWLWATVNPDIPQEYIPVEGLENVYMIKHDDGTVEYVKYIRNEDGSFAFIPVDENGNPLKNKEEENTSIIPDNYIRVTGNIYSVYNEHGVCIGYKERKYDEMIGKYYWIDTNESNVSNQNTPTQPENNPESTPSYYEQVETINEKKVAGDWVITYETVITKTYDDNGNLVSTKKEGPTEISREKLEERDGMPINPENVVINISEEYNRASLGLEFEDELSSKVMAIINEKRVETGKPALEVNMNSNAYFLAAIKAADMARLNYSDDYSPTYGKLKDMCLRYGINANSPMEFIWKAGANKTAEDIASRLLIMHSDTIINQNFSDVAIAIVSRGGYYYIDMVLLV